MVGMVGKTVSHYRILEKLGQGGMGVVYKARDTKLDRIVALKFLPPELTRDSEAQTRFIHEAKAAAAITHSNICTVHEVDEAEGRTFIAMEFVEGRTLRDEIETGPLKLDAVLEIAIQVADGLQRAHDKNVVHRDIKSANIMLTPDGEVKIMDFGLAKLGGATKVTRAGATVGTIAYMSPEQARGEEPDRRTDVWSLGVVLYEMLTGCLPFKGDYGEAVVYSILNKEPEPVTALRSGVPMEMERIVRKAMSKSPAERYQSLTDLLVDLRTLARQWESGTGERPPVKTQAVEKSIAVLPLASLSESKEDEYFSDGITEDIIAQLSKIAGLKVISRQSVMRYKGSVKSLREIGRELGVSTVLEGSIRRAGNSVRIVSQLIDAQTDEHLWADTYDRQMKDIFAIQSEVAQQIATALEARLSSEVKQRMERKPTDSLEAYDYYLRGREYYFRYRRQDNETAIEFFKKALALDPSYSLACAGLGDAYTLRAVRFGFSRTWIDSAIEVSQKGISIDPTCAEAHKALGIAYVGKGWIRKCLGLLGRAMELNPSYYPAFVNAGVANVNIGMYDDALECYERALALNPTFAPVYGYLAHVYTTLGDFAKAESYIGKALDLQPDLTDAHCDLIDVYLQQGRLDETAALCEKVLSLAPEEIDALDSCGYAELIMGNHARARRLYEKALGISASEIPGDTGISLATRLAYVYRKQGELEKAEGLMRERLMIDRKLEEEGNQWWRIPYDVSAINAIKDEKAEAYLWLRKAVDAGWRHFRLGLIDPVFEQLGADEEFRQIMAEVKGMVDEMRKRVEAT